MPARAALGSGLAAGWQLRPPFFFSSPPPPLWAKAPIVKHEVLFFGRPLAASLSYQPVRAFFAFGFFSSASTRAKNSRAER